jgi:hypothetical protein
MITPTPTPNPTAAEIFRSEMFARLDVQAEMITSLRADSARQDELIVKLTDGLTSLVSGLTSAAATARAASQPAAPAGETVTYTADTLVHNVANGKDSFYLRGGQFAQFGIRIWPEVLEKIGLGVMIKSPPALHPIQPIDVIAIVEDYVNKKGEPARGPQKIIGRA